MLAPVMDYGLLRERFAALVTDGLRAKLSGEYGVRDTGARIYRYGAYAEEHPAPRGEERIVGGMCQMSEKIRAGTGPQSRKKRKKQQKILQNVNSFCRLT